MLFEKKIEKDWNPKILFTLGLKGPVRKEIISRMIEEPEDIAVDLASRQMFISDYGTNAKIYAANLDGSGLRPLIESKIMWPSSLAIDYPNSR